MPHTGRIKAWPNRPAPAVAPDAENEYIFNQLNVRIDLFAKTLI